MRTLIKVSIAVVVIFFGTIVIYGLNTEEKEKTHYPAFESVVIEDGRSTCEKKSQVAVLRVWDEACVTTERGDRCELPKDMADRIYKEQGFYIAWCNKGN